MICAEKLQVAELQVAGSAEPSTFNLQLSTAAARPRTTNPTCFLNRESCREFLLEQALGTRAHKFHRVSIETLQQLNESVRQQMIAIVRRLPSKGRTI